jgi:hypothetical protein
MRDEPPPAQEHRRAMNGLLIQRALRILAGLDDGGVVHRPKVVSKKRIDNVRNNV